MSFGVKGPSTDGIRSLGGASYPSCHFQVYRVREYSTDLCLCFSVACREPTNAKLKGPATARMIYKSRAVGFNQGQVGILFKVYKEMLESHKYASFYMRMEYG